VPLAWQGADGVGRMHELLRGIAGRVATRMAPELLLARACADSPLQTCSTERATTSRRASRRKDAMNARIKQLRDLVVAIDRADRNIEPMAPAAYQAAAKTAMVLTNEEMGLLPIGDFAGPISALQNMAENIFFGINGCFADLDGTGRAPVALSATRDLMKRLRSTSCGESQEITASLCTRLRGAPAGVLQAAAEGPPRRRRRAAPGGTRDEQARG
jgi:hypothetical protein